MRILAIACLAILALVWFDGRAIHAATEKLGEGSLAGVEACIALRQGDLVTQDEAREACIRRHEQKLGPSLRLNGALSVTSRGISGSLRNGYDDRVVTEITMTGYAYDETGASRGYDASVRTWLFPSGAQQVSGTFAKPVAIFDTLPWCPQDADVGTWRSCKFWDITSFRVVWESM